MSVQTETPPVEQSTQSKDSSTPPTETPKADSQVTPPSEGQSSNEVPPKTDAPVVPPATDDKGVPADKTTEAPKDVPEEYELELAEDSPLSEEDLNEIASEAARLSLSKDDAIKLISLKEKAYKNGTEKVKAEYQAKLDQARKTIQADPMFATPEEAKKTFASMTRAIETFGDLDMVELVKSPEFGNNVVIARFLKKLGDALGPADANQTEMQGGNGAASNATAEEDNASLKALYPSFFKDKK
jgi:hypothetical protein